MQPLTFGLGANSPLGDQRFTFGSSRGHSSGAPGVSFNKKWGHVLISTPLPPTLGSTADPVDRQPHVPPGWFSG